MMSSKYRKRLAVVVVMILLLLGGVLGVTISYFQDQTDIVKNTFAGGALFNDPVKNFTIVEQKVTEAPVGSATKYQLTSGTTTGFTYTVLPGVSIPKRPYIKVDTLLMDAYLYVVVDTNGVFSIAANSNNKKWVSASEKEDGKVSWEMADGWTFLKTQGNKAIYYYTGKNSNGKLPAGTYSEIDIMKQTGSGNGRTSVTVGANYNASDNALNLNLDFKAYICQTSADNSSISAGEAWTLNFAATVGN